MSVLLKNLGEEKYFAIMNKGQAGAGRLVRFPQNETEETTLLPLPNGNYDTWTVCGDSLETDDPQTTICDGFRLVVRNDFTAAEAVGRLCVLRLYNSEIAIKKVFRKKAGLLRLETNGNGKPETVEAPDVEILGIVEWVLRKA